MVIATAFFRRKLFAIATVSVFFNFFCVAPSIEEINRQISLVDDEINYLKGQSLKSQTELDRLSDLFSINKSSAMKERKKIEKT